MREWLELAAEVLGLPDQNLVVVTGAGISLASGIPTFRGSDPDAVWANDVLEKGTRHYFHKDPAGSWSWYLKRFDGCRSAEPNAAHHALVDIERAVLAKGGRFTLITQNVDGLHIRAGSQNVIEVHGSARHMRCSKRQCVNGAPRGLLDWDDSMFTEFRADPVFEKLPRCPVCRSLIRAHVLWFDESYQDHASYGIDAVMQVMYGSPTAIMFVGTSFSVNITNMIISAAEELSVPMLVLDPHLKKSPLPEMTLINAASEVFLPELVERLQ